MFKILTEKFIKNKDNISSQEVRTAYGMLCGIIGIILNVLLFAAKLTAGLISGSIAIIADSFNNLSDAGSSIITLIGFRLANQKPDNDHPFGHGRMEYLSGLFVSVLIILMGFELGKSSLEKMISPEIPEFKIFVLVILGVSVLIKLYMFVYNNYAGNLISSEPLKAAARDSLCDMASTAAVLVCSLICLFTNINLDAYCGILVAIFILRTGILSLIDTVDPLLGQPPESEFVNKINDTVMAHREVIGIHDLIVHDYGPGRRMISLHAEIPADSNILEAHDAIDNIEKELLTKLGCLAVIHMDPVMNNDPFTCSLKETVLAVIEAIDPGITVHDFRTVRGHTHTNIIFDVVVPFGYKLSDSELTDTISRKVSDIDKSYFCVINIGKSYVKKEKV